MRTACTALVFAFVLTAPLVMSRGRPAIADDRPNIVFIISDGQDNAHLGFLSAKPEHADRIAAMPKQVLAWWKATGGKPIEGIKR